MSVSKVGKKWRGQIAVNGHTVHVGMFETEQEAVLSCEAAKKYNSYTFVDDWLFDTKPKEGLVLKAWNKIKSWYRG